MFKRHFTAQFVNSSSEITTVGMLQMNTFRSKCVIEFSEVVFGFQL